MATQTTGADYAWSHPSIAALKTAGVHFVSRYLSWDRPGSAGKNFNVTTEKAPLLNAGIDIILNWEYDAQDALRGAAGGTIDGREAARQAAYSGYPRGAELPSSMDWDVTPAQKPTCLAYARAFAAELKAGGWKYDVYGGYWIVKYLFDQKAIFNGWQTYAWSAGLWDPRATFRQVHNGVRIGGADCDLDIMIGQAHTWLHPDGATVSLPSGPGAGVPVPVPVPVTPTPPVVVPGPAVYVHGSEGDEHVNKLIQDGPNGPVYVGEVGGHSCRWVPNMESLDNLRWWMAQAKQDTNVYPFVRGTFRDVIGSPVGALPPA